MLSTVVVVDSLGAWRAPIAGFIADVLNVGYSISSGIVLLSLHEDYGVPQEILLPTALTSTGLMLILSPAVEWISVRIGSKGAMLIAALLISASFFSIFWLPITGASVIALLGASVGIGRAFASLVVYKFTMICFKKRRGAAASVLKAGAMSGNICLPPILAFLLDFYGARITLLLIGALFLNLLIVVVLIPSTVLDENTGKRINPKAKWSCCDKSETASNESGKLPLQKTVMVKAPLVVRLPYLVFMNFFLLLSMSSGMFSMNLFALYADELGLSKYQIAAALSTRSGVDLCFRLLNGLIFDKLETRGKLLLFALSHAIGFIGIVVLLSLSSDAFAAVFVYAVCFAIGNAFGATGWMQIEAALTGPLYVGRVMSLVMFSGGIITLLGSFGLSFLKSTSSYQPLYFFIGFSLIIDVLGYLLGAAILPQCTREKERETEAPFFDEIELLKK